MVLSSSGGQASVKLPTFIIAGVPKAGTTSLHAYLAQHPQVYMSPLKEPMYFGAQDVLAGPFRAQFLAYAGRVPAHLREFLDEAETRRGQRYALHWETYVRLFQGVRDETAIGEASIDYFWLPSAAQAIRRQLPDARLIFVLRDPADKLGSSFHVARRRHPDLVFEDWFRAATRPGSPSWPLADSARYATHLARFLELFPRDRIRIYFYDAYRLDPQGMLRDIFTFLGVNPDHPIDLRRRHNEGVIPRSAFLHRLRRRMLGDFAPTRPLPDVIRRGLQRWYYRPRRDASMPSADRELVITYYRDEIRRTEDITGRDLSAWLH
jgi:hypothetical protein